MMSLVRFDLCVITVKQSIIVIVNIQLSTLTSTGDITKKYLGTGLQLARLFEAGQAT